jgi:hypothetical protein
LADLAIIDKELKMGWASGSRLFNSVIEVLKNNIDDKQLREDIYIELIEAFEDCDWDTQDECMDRDPAFDSALKELHPNWYDRDDDYEEEDDEL